MRGGEGRGRHLDELVLELLGLVEIGGSLEELLYSEAVLSTLQAIERTN